MAVIFPVKCCMMLLFRIQYRLGALRKVKIVFNQLRGAAVAVCGSCSLASTKILLALQQPEEYHAEVFEGF